MSDGMTRKPASWTMFRLMAGLLIVLFAWRLLIPAHEYSMRAEQVLDIIVNLGLLIGLYGAHRNLLRQAPDDARWGTGTPLYWAGVVSGVGMLLIRLTSNAAWWTGHLMYDLG